MDHATTKATALCVYCGWDADTRDHVMSRTWTGTTGRSSAVTVPACRDSNTRLSDRYAPTIEEARKLLWEALERKHRKLLVCAPRTDEELAEFGFHLRSSLEAREAKRRIIRYRLDNLARDPEDPINDWLIYAAAYGDNLCARLLSMRQAEALAAGHWVYTAAG